MPRPPTDADAAQCAHCGARVRIPEQHRELQRRAAAHEAARREAEALLVRLDTPPSYPTKIAARVLDQPMLGFWLFYGIPVGIGSVLAALRANTSLAPVLGYASADDVPLWLTFSEILLLVCLVAFVPRVLGVYANRRASARRLLLAGLAAKPPSAKGGPAMCRVCGAPLTIPDGAVVARCLYCEADNALRIRHALVAGTAAAAQTTARSVQEAAARDREERSHTRTQLLRELARYLVTTALFAGLITVYAIDTERDAVKRHDATPVLGFVALTVAVLLLIGLMLFSRGGGDEERARREANDVPSWVAVVGPIVLLIVLYIGLRLFS